jgi:hypothetical protein
MDELFPAALETAIETALETALVSADDVVSLAPVSGSNAMVFVLITALGVAMALVYLPLRLFLTITARSRRLKLLQRIRRLREELGQPATTA